MNYKVYSYSDAWVNSISVKLVSQDVIANTSTINFICNYSMNYKFSDAGSKTAEVYVNDVLYRKTTSYSLGWTGNVPSSADIINQTVIIPHNPDGTCAFTFGVKYGTWSLLIEELEQNYDSIKGTYIYTYNLPQIPQATLITSISDTNVNGTFNFVLNRKSPGHTNNLIIRSGNNTIKTINSVAASGSFTFTTAEQDNIYSKIPNSIQLVLSIDCYTYLNGTQIGSPTISSFTSTVPSSIIPTFTSITATELNTTVSTAIGTFVKTLSNLQLKINGAAGVKSSTITAYKINLNGVNYTNSTVTTGIVGWNGTQTATATITDSRGRTATKTLSITVLDYSKPNISAFSVERSNSDGTINLLGTYAKLTRLGTVTSLNNKNSMGFRIYTKLKTATSWGSIVASQDWASGTYSISGHNLSAVYAVTSSYEFKLEFYDKFNVSISTTSLSTGAVIADLGKQGLGVGKIWERGVLDVGGSAFFNGSISVSGNVAVGVNTTTANAWSNGIQLVTSRSDNSEAHNYLRAGSDGKIRWYNAVSGKQSFIWTSDAQGAGSGLDADMLDGKNGDQYLSKSGTQMADGADLNSLVTAGMYRLGGGNLNGPSDNSWCQLLVIRDVSDVVGQILFTYTGKAFIRSGNPPESGGGGSWGNWSCLTPSHGVGIPTSLAVGEVYYQYD